MGLCRRSLGIHTPLHGPFISPDASTVFSWIRQGRADSRGPKQKSKWETKPCKCAIRSKVEARIPYCYFSNKCFLSYREEEMRSFYKGWSLTKRMHPHLINTVFLQNSDRMSSWAISSQGRITRTNYQPGSKSVNFSVSVSWRTLMRQWWCCKGTFNNKRASRKKAVKSSNIKEKMVCQ